MLPAVPRLRAQVSHRVQHVGLLLVAQRLVREFGGPTRNKLCASIFTSATAQQEQAMTDAANYQAGHMDGIAFNY